MRVLVTGASGMLGLDVLAAEGFTDSYLYSVARRSSGAH